MNEVIYLSRTGLLEPLGQSQVLAYLRGLCDDYSITLISFERREDLADTTRVADARAECERLGIRWRPQRFRAKPRVISPIISMSKMLWLASREVRAGRGRVIHARSYVPAAVALLVCRMTNVPFIFDMRALWPEELITAGRLRRGSLMHQAIVRVERMCLRHAAAVVSLTHAAKDYLEREYPQELAGKEVEVIPTCADLQRFKPRSVKKPCPIVHGCIGTILSGWFRTDWLAAWLSVVSMQDSDARFEIVTRDDAVRVRALLDPENELAGRLRICPRTPEAMPDTVRGHDLSVMFFTDGLSKLGSSPTRLAEVLACGLPVVANDGVGDVAKVVRGNDVGVIVEGPDKLQMQAAFDALTSLMQDPELPRRCRATAESLFSLASGTAAYRDIYDSILRPEANA